MLPGLISAPNLFWTLGPNAAMTLFDAGAHQAELDIAKAEKNEAAIAIFAKDAEGIASAAHVGAEVQIREDQRVILRQYDWRRHRFIVARKYY